MRKLEDYRTIVFDCDGVVLNSNKIKTRAFLKSALVYGEEKARLLVDYHIKNGGVSRYKKFEWFLKEIAFSYTENNLESLLSTYADEVSKELLECEIADGLFSLREKLFHQKWLIVSGGDQTELRQVFKERKIDHLFDSGIFGSPETKDLILTNETEKKNIIFPALFVGDSKYDYLAASKMEIDFLFLSEWSEFNGWELFFKEKNIFYAKNISEIENLKLKPYNYNI